MFIKGHLKPTSKLLNIFKISNSRSPSLDYHYFIIGQKCAGLYFFANHFFKWKLDKSVHKKNSTLYISTCQSLFPLHQ